MQRNSLETRVTRRDRGLKVMSHEKKLKVAGMINLGNKKGTIPISKYMRGYYKE